MKLSLFSVVLFGFSFLVIDGGSLLEGLKGKTKLLQTLQQQLGQFKDAPPAPTQQPEAQDVVEEKPKGLLAKIKGKVAGLKAKVTGKAPFVPKDNLFKAILKFYSSFPKFTPMVSTVNDFADQLKDFEKSSNLPIMKGVSLEDYPHLLVMSYAQATTKSNFKLLVKVLWKTLVIIPKERNELMWKYMALCALKLKPASEWRKKALLGMFKAATKVAMESKSQDLFNLPISEAGIIQDFQSAGKLPWSVKPRTAQDLLNGLLVMMASGGTFRPLPKAKTISTAWAACNELTNPFLKNIVKDLLNKRSIDIQSLDSELKLKMARQLMTRSAKKLVVIVKDASQTITSPTLLPVQHVRVDSSEQKSN